MTQWHLKSRKKPSGGRRSSTKRTGKKLAWKGRDFTATTSAQEPEISVIRTMGGNAKARAKRVDTASIANPSTKKVEQAKITTVIDNPANRQYTRRNIITKGGIITVELGGKERYARVSSRPGQSATVSAVLLDEAESKKIAEEKTKQKAKKPEKAKKEAVKEPEEAKEVEKA